VCARLTSPRDGVHFWCTHTGTTMKHVGIKQAREELPELVHRAEAGEEIVITRQGRAVARLVAAPRAPKALPTLQEFRGSLGTGGTPAVKLVRDERNAR
jgi:prevent-host-death family protein